MKKRGQPFQAPSRFSFELVDETLFLKHDLNLATVEQHLSKLTSLVQKYRRKRLVVNLKEVERLDSAGAISLQYLHEIAAKRGIQLTLVEIPNHLRKSVETFLLPEIRKQPPPETPSSMEKLAHASYQLFVVNIVEFIYLMADLFYWFVVDLFQRKAHRKGEFVLQAELIGINALPIIILISFLIGSVLALQSAQQLRLFGANIYIADLVVIALVREMGPLLTAIMVAGRSGSSIASEIATMVISEEVDALKTMALHPLRYIVVPKMHAAMVMLPILTMFANVFGILGGLVIAYLYLDLVPNIFLSRMIDVLYFRDILTGILKSLVFAGGIVITSSYLGFRARGGPEGVGRTTTQAVVVSIFLVILADSILGLIFY
ncbi:MAG: MlaE family lipid ABC transporter permease subunit [Calditrichaeota bacterium]|nr:MAG: MlaE family lipid ABC transporter permease subunit [Calditrichota bacterium]